MSGLNERSRHQIALLAGDDLEGSLAEEARRSVDSCPHCRGHWLRIRGCLGALERAGKGSSSLFEASLWPAIESRLTRPMPARPERFNGWVPALSMAAACIALLIAGQMEAPSPQDSPDPGSRSGPETVLDSRLLMRAGLDRPLPADYHSPPADGTDAVDPATLFQKRFIETGPAEGEDWKR